MEKLNLAYLTVEMAKSYSFYMIPKELIDNPAFDDIDYGSKLLYGLMLNRASLSAIHSDFIDENGNVYIIYTIEQVIESMRCARQTAVNMLKQLDNIGLIEKRRLGQGKPSMIYVKDFSSLDTKKSKKQNTESPKNRKQKVQKIERSNTDNSKNNLSKTDISIYPRQGETEADKQEPAAAEMIDMIDNTKIETIRETVADKIGLGDLVIEYPDKKEKIMELYQSICDVLAGDKADTVRIAKKQLPIATVKQAFASLGKAHILYVLECLEKNGSNINNNAKGYIITALYNSIHSIGYYKPNSQSAFSDNSKPTIKYDDEFFTKLVKKSLRF